MFIEQVTGHSIFYVLPTHYVTISVARVNYTIWKIETSATTQQNQQNDLCAKSDQSLRCPHEESLGP